MRGLLLAIFSFNVFTLFESTSEEYAYTVNYFDETASHRTHRQHRRRSAQHDERFLDFRFTEEPSNVVAKNGRVQLNCRYSLSGGSRREVRIEWRKDGTPLSAHRPTGKLLVLPSGSLIIENAGAGDKGIYQCIVHVMDRNRFTWTYLSRRASVRLPSLSRFEIQPEDKDAYRGQAVAFKCVLDSQPEAKIDWYHNDRLLTPGEDESVSVFRISSTLEIQNIQARHEGTYKCNASNGEKSRVSGVARLKIRPENNVGNEFTEPSFVLVPRGEIVNEGDPIVLECLANGWPRPDVRWLKGSETISADGNRIQRMGTSSLLILKATPDDAGVYTCRASNFQESVDSSAAVQVKVAPRLTTKPKDAVAQETTDVEFSCVASGNPSAALTWYKNGESIIASEYFVIEANRLRILGLVKTDQGVYQCMAENDAGMVQGSAQLIVDSADTTSLAASNGQPRTPSEPLGVIVSAVGSRFATLAWDQPVQRYGSLLAYHIFYKEEGSDRERMVNSSSTSFTITPLQPDTAYIFRIVAENEAGMGKSSLPLSVTTTREQAVPGKVKNLKAVALSPETVELSWEPPTGNSPAVVGYKVFYIRAHPELGEKETQSLTKKTSHTLYGLDKYTEYSVRVEAEGANGAGLSSEPVIVRTLSQAPSAPPGDVRAEVVSTTSIQVQWSPPPPEKRNGVITGYRVKYKTKHRGTKGNTLVVDGNELSYTITGLEPATPYMLRVAAVNQNGSGMYSEWVYVDTPLEDKDEGQVPGPPISLKVQPSADSVHVSWLAPADGVMVRGYIVGWGINIPDVAQVNVGQSARYYTIKGLKPGRDYVISLRAYNAMGNGFPIYETLRTLSPSSGSTDLGIFNSPDSSSALSNETPVGVHAEARSSSSIRVTWTDPGMDVDTPYSRQYTVRYSSSAENSGHYRYMNTTETEVLVEGLRPNTQYEFAVRVNVARTSSQWSMTAVNKTLSAPPSSAPRDLTVVQPANGDPQSLTLNWQPPKYGNGDIEEYLIFYSDRLDAHDKDWSLGNVKGDRLSITLTGLIPRSNYYFKMQARNTKGYGPLSPVLKYVPGAPPPRIFQSSESAQESLSATTFLSNPLYMVILGSALVVMTVLIILTVWCVKSKSTKSAAAGGYVPGRKANNEGKVSQDYWIQGHHVRGPEFVGESPSASVSDLKHFEGNLCVVESPPPRYQTLQELTVGHPSDARRVPPTLSGYNSGVMVHNEPRDRCRVGVAEPIQVQSVPYGSDNDSNGTLTRSYHQSSSSLEGRQRTPQVIYTGGGRHQPVAKIDFSDHGSSYGSSQALHAQTPPPQLPNQGPPVGPPSQVSDGYRTLRGNSGNGNPLKSFTQLAGAPPPLSPSQGERTSHVVRPVVIASPSARGKPAGVVIGQKCTQVPVGRAMAQPRVNVNSIYAPYASCTASEKVSLQNERNDTNFVESQPLQPSNSTEELNAQMESLDTMIDDLQALQHEFNGGS